MRLIAFTSAWAVGISVSRVLPAMLPSLWFAAFAVSLGGRLVLRRRGAWWIFASLIAFFAGGFRQSLTPSTSEIAAYNGQSATITGLVISEPRLRGDRIQFRLASEEIFVNSELSRTSGLVLVEADAGAEVQYGDRIRATGMLALAATWDTFSYADYLGRQGVFSIMQNAGLEVVDSGHGSQLIAALLRLRTNVQRSIASVIPEPQSGLLTGMLLGDEDGIAPELKDEFSRVGASHVVAISGFNMVIVSGIVVRVLSSLFRDNKTVVTLNALSVIAVYALFVGASPGILRAALMSGLLVVGSQLDRKTFVPTSLAFATLLLSLRDPNVLLDIGFQFSFLAVLGLSLFANPLSARFRRLLESIMPVARRFRAAQLSQRAAGRIDRGADHHPSAHYPVFRTAVVGGRTGQLAHCTGTGGGAAPRHDGIGRLRVHSCNWHVHLLGGLGLRFLDNRGCSRVR